jgi:hypothetical protein
MPEGQDEQPPAEGSALLPETPQSPGQSAKSARPSGGSWHSAWWLAAILLLVIAGIGSSPFWARDVSLLLPWGSESTVATEDYGALAARLAAVEKRPAPPSPDIGAINSAISALAQRVDQLEPARNTDQHSNSISAAAQTELRQLEERLSAFEAKSAARASGDAAQFEKLRQELAQIGRASADLADRLPAIERQVGTAASAARTDAALLAALLRMREAVQAARPFAAEYDAFIALARDQPDLIAAAEPLGRLAQEGVKGNAALSESLGRISGRIVSAAVPPVGSDLRTQGLAWLHSLVTIRRVDDSGQSGQEPAVNVAEAALARGDLSGAVSALQTLSASNSEAIQSWLQAARQRLAAEGTLTHLQELLVARLGAPAEAPRGAPTEMPAKSAQPS